jgi:alginate O-acetyltransferase complex protein AlgI
MLFNSLDFAIFLPIVFLLYWFVAQKNLKLQNALIVLASYVFYGWWDWRFLSLIIFSTVVDYLVGQKLKVEEKQSKRKVLLWTSILVNLGFLGFFKYYNFFLENFVDAFSLFGMQINANSLNIILPVGISFYTFQTLSYTIDVYKKKLEPTKDFVAFSAFVCFFPQLVAGPIERATNLLPQFINNRKFNYRQAVSGVKLIIWGFFMKLVVADRLSIYVDAVYGNPVNHSSITLITATVFFTFQIYCDFAGYSNIAIGCSKLLGIDLMTNFKRPYFSQNVSEFWSRWHISLSSWFRDYLYIPLGGNRVNALRKKTNLIITFTVSGLWHGANWTFVIWGLINGVYLIAFKGLNIKRSVNIFNTLLKIMTTFVLINITWVFFRSEDISQAILIFKRILSANGDLFIDGNAGFIYSLIGVIILLFKDFVDEINITSKMKNNKYINVFWYFFIVMTILLIGVFDGGQFIYFKF